jgi:hypothetical protein
MSKMVDGELTNSWLQRARADASPDACFCTESSTDTKAIAITSRATWCAWEVWLHHIDQPRRRLAGRRPQSSD